MSATNMIHSVVFNTNEIMRMLNHMPLGIFVLDSCYRVLFWNKCLQYWTSVTEDRIIGRDIREHYPLFKEKRFASRIASIFQGGPPIIFSSYIHKYIIPAPLPNNTMRLQHTTVSPLRREDGCILGMFTIQDVTEVNTRLIQQKKAEEELRNILGAIEETNKKLEASNRLALQKAREADEANRAKSVFLANMSHEIRTPMSGILGVLDMLADQERNQEKLTLLQMTKDSANTLLRIINGILDLSKVEAGKLELYAEDVKLLPILERTFQLYSLPAQGKGLCMSLDLPNDLPDRVHVDATKLEQILRNLMDNAVKFTNRGNIVLGAEIISREPAVVNVRFQVKDTGIGIPDKTLPHLFQPFSQADSSYAKIFGGTGLGLALCKRLAELMGGTLTVHSEPGQGSTFSLYMPLPLPQDSVYRDPALEKSAHSTNDPLSGTLRVLAAEDDELIRKYLSFILTRRGYQADIVSSGMEAVNAFQNNKYDIILMDIQMPEMDGMEATRRIREIETETPANLLGASKARTPIIALTAYAMQEERETFLTGGMDGFSPKPIQADQLIQEIERLTGQSDPHGEVREKLPAKPLSSPLEKKEVFRLSDVFDFEVIKTRYEDNTELWEEVSTLFVHQELPSYKEQLFQANQVGDYPALAKMAHKLKGALGTLCAESAYQAALVLEKTARDAEINENLPPLHAALARMLAELERIESYKRNRSQDTPTLRTQ